MGKVWIFAMFVLVLIGLAFLATFLAPIAQRWVKKMWKVSK